ncbi:DJ-1/PfpI family protein [Cryptosporangium sp. NPDC048952]|uniref:DJ-1/PfpI family protein n=1 Tax=Cryptosporangium sp. NPDC048952 TaxID=3363961 RepID=UPI0037114F44
MHIAILTFEGYNELDSLIALGVLNRVKDATVSIATPTRTVRSMNGVVIEQMATLDEACDADAVIVGSGIATREVVEDPAIMSTLANLDPSRQLVAAQCSGALVLARLGLLDGVPACTDLTSKPWVVAAGVEVLNQPFYAAQNVATAGGCLASHYLAAWVLTRLVGEDAARDALHYVAPVGEKDEYVERAWRNISPYLPAAALSGAVPSGTSALRA